LNKKTTHEDYPLPLPDEVQDCLAKSVVFSTSDLQSGYWHLPVSIKDKEKQPFSQALGWASISSVECPFG